MKKTLSVFLLLAVLASLFVFAGCGNTNPSDTTTPAATSGSDDPEETTSAGPGFEKCNYDTEFVILQNNTDGLDSDLFAENESGDLLNDITYKRLLSAADYLGVEFKFEREAGNWNSKMPDKIYTDVASNPQSSFDMVCMGLNTGIMGGYVDIFKNINEMNINLDNPWWVAQISEDASVNGRLITLSGDAMKSTYGYIGCVFANPNVAEEFGLNVNFYKLVKDREWTLDKFLDLQKSVVRDVNGDYTIDTANDVFGWANAGISSRVMWSCANVNLISRDADGAYNWVEKLDDRTLTWIKKLYDASQRNNVFYYSSTKGDTGSVKAFAENRCLFMTFLVSTAKDLTDMAAPYAILPMPMYDFDQDDYISANMSAFNTIYFPENIRDAEMSAKVAEYFGWYGKEYVIPQYYDSSLKFQYSNVQDNIDMLDLLRDKLRLTANELFGPVGNGIGLTAMTAANTAVSGFYASPVATWGGKIKGLRGTLETYMNQY